MPGNRGTAPKADCSTGCGQLTPPRRAWPACTVCCSESSRSCGVRPCSTTPFTRLHTCPSASSSRIWRSMCRTRLYVGSTASGPSEDRWIPPSQVGAVGSGEGPGWCKTKSGFGVRTDPHSHRLLQQGPSVPGWHCTHPAAPSDHRFPTADLTGQGKGLRAYRGPSRFFLPPWTSESCSVKAWIPASPGVGTWVEVVSRQEEMEL